MSWETARRSNKRSTRSLSCVVPPQLDTTAGASENDRNDDPNKGNGANAVTPVRPALVGHYKCLLLTVWEGVLRYLLGLYITLPERNNPQKQLRTQERCIFKDCSKLSQATPGIVSWSTTASWPDCRCFRKQWNDPAIKGTDANAVTPAQPG